MVGELKRRGFKIFLETPEYLTARGQFPKAWIPVGCRGHNLTGDFVLARKESGYGDGRRPDTVVPGTLDDDLARRDFTMNALAKDADGNLHDPFNGRQDIKDRIIRAVGDPVERLEEDALRAVRALRFCVTKGFTIDVHLAHAMQVASVLDSLKNNISDERIQSELSKMFRLNTVESLQVLSEFSHLTTVMFAGTVSLDATMKTKGRK